MQHNTMLVVNNGKNSTECSVCGIIAGHGANGEASQKVTHPQQLRSIAQNHEKIRNAQS